MSLERKTLAVSGTGERLVNVFTQSLFHFSSLSQICSLAFTNIKDHFMPLSNCTTNMAGFDDLPNEIILETLRFVLPEDLENFAQASKRVFLLAKPFLERHRQLIRRYKRVCSRPPFQVLGTIPSLLRDIFKNPSIRRYVRDVELGSLVTTYTGNIQNDTFDEDEALYKQQFDLVDAVVNQSNDPDIKSLYHATKWQSQSSKFGYAALLIALHLTLLPNLNRLSVIGYYHSKYFSMMIRLDAVN